MSQPDTPVQVQPPNHEKPNLSNPKYAYKKTTTEDLRILAHAQYQFQTHLSPVQKGDSTWQPTPQELLQQLHSKSHPRSTHQISSSAPGVKPDRCISTTHIFPPQWGGINDLESSSHEAAGDPMDYSLESDFALEIEEDNIVESIEVDASASPGTERHSGRQVSERNADHEEVHRWDEVQQTWDGHVRHKESWVRRAGLKREGEGSDAQQGTAKKKRMSR